MIGKIWKKYDQIWKGWKKNKLNSEKIWKIWKKRKLNSEKTWKIRKKSKYCSKIYCVLQLFEEYWAMFLSYQKQAKTHLNPSTTRL
jgi:hypothetical protein